MHILVLLQANKELFETIMWWKARTLFSLSLSPDLLCGLVFLPGPEPRSDPSTWSPSVLSAPISFTVGSCNYGVVLLKASTWSCWVCLRRSDSDPVVHLKTLKSGGQVGPLATPPSVVLLLRPVNPVAEGRKWLVGESMMWEEDQMQRIRFFCHFQSTESKV